MIHAGYVAEKGFNFVQSLRYERAESDAQLDAIFKLRYSCYLQEGIISLNEQQSFSDHFDEMPNAINVALFREKSLFSAIRLHILNSPEDQSPTRFAFPDIIDPLVAEGRILIDPTRFIVDDTGERQSPLGPLSTLRVATAAAVHFDAQIVLAPVREEHCPFYRRYLGCSVIAPARPYPGLSAKLCLMAVEHRNVRDQIAIKYPFMVTNAADHKSMFG